MELRVVRDKQPLWSGIRSKTIMQYFKQLCNTLRLQKCFLYDIAFTGMFPEVFEGKENQSFLYIAAKILNSSGFEKQNYGNWFLSWEVFLVNVVHYGTLSLQV